MKRRPGASTSRANKPISFRVSSALYDEIEAESRARKLLKSDIARERLARTSNKTIAQLMGKLDWDEGSDYKAERQRD